MTLECSEWDAAPSLNQGGIFLWLSTVASKSPRHEVFVPLPSWQGRRNLVYYRCKSHSGRFLVFLYFPDHISHLSNTSDVLLDRNRGSLWTFEAFCPNFAFLVAPSTSLFPFLNICGDVFVARTRIRGFRISSTRSHLSSIVATSR